MAKDLHFAVLLDCYASILTPHQENMMRQYYEEDLTLAEIAQLCNVTRQSVLDGIHRGKQLLLDMEAKFSMVQKSARLFQNYTEIDALLQEISEATDAEQRRNLCNAVRDKIRAGQSLAQSYGAAVQNEIQEIDLEAMEHGV